MGMNVGSNQDDEDVMLDVNMTPLISTSRMAHHHQFRKNHLKSWNYA